MIKIRLTLLFAFVFLNATAQNQNPDCQVIDSLKNVITQIKKDLPKNKTKKASKQLHQLLKGIEYSEKRLEQLKKKKILKGKIINCDIQELTTLKIKAIFKLMLKGYNVKGNVDSIDYYRNKVQSLTSDKLSLAKSHGYSGYTHYLNDNHLKSIKHYFTAYSIIKGLKNDENKVYKYKVLINLNLSLINLGETTFAEKNLKKIEEIIQSLKESKRYTSLLELIKIERAAVLIAKNEYEKSFKILKSVDTNNIDRKALKNKYYGHLEDTYLGMEKYTLAENYFDLVFPEGNYKDNDYYLAKLEYAIRNKNIEKTNFYFNKLDETQKYLMYKPSDVLQIKSDYLLLNKEYKKASNYFKEAIKLIILEERKKSLAILEVYKFDNDLSKELAEVKRLNELKDQQIIDNQLFYIKMGAAILFIIIVVLAFVEWAARKKRYLDNLTQKSKRTILEAKGQFLENMSHEIRTPITSILGYLSLLKEENLISDKRLNYTNSAIDNTKKMMSSLDNFLNLTSLEHSSQFKNANASINISNFIQDIKSTFSANLEIKKIKLYFKTNAEDSLMINYDIESLTIIVNNLISNAIKYSNSNTSIYLTLFFEESKLRLMVKDEGFGISENEKETIFSRFYQTENNTSNSGFGIGLSLTNNLIKKLNGKISLETAVNVGSVFKVELPIVINNYNLNTTQIDQKFKEICTNQCIEPEINKNNNLPKALVVDDNTEMIIYLKEIFSDFLDCTFAFNGKEALSKIEEQSFEIIISDFKMPLMNGIEFKEALNEKATSKNIPFIFMTSIVKDKVEDFNLLSFEDYIEKPFRKDEIISRIQFALEKTLNRKKLASTIESEIEFDSSSSELIKKVKNCILENLTNPDFNVVKLCEVCGYGQKKLNEILKSKIGLSIVNTILEIRLLKAYDLVIKNRYETLKEVVYAVGMNSRPYFNKKFEMRFGIKPGELKKKYKK